jgi:hypothetical protein
MKQELVGGTTYGHANPDDVPGASMTASRFIRANGTTTKRWLTDHTKCVDGRENTNAKRPSLGIRNDQFETREETMKMRLVILAGLAIGSAVFSGCANGHSTSTSGQQQNTPVNSHARYQGVDSPVWVDWTKPRHLNRRTYREACLATVLGWLDATTLSFVTPIPGR